MEMELNDKGCTCNQQGKTKTPGNKMAEDAICCDNCAYSLEKNNKIFCSDRSFIMRLLFGLEQMPSGAHCNRFVPSKTR